MITLRNTQRKIACNTNALKADAQAILRFINYPDFDLGIWLTTNKTIREYNRTYRDKDKPTDILSFSYHEHLKAGEPITVVTEDDKNLGDLIIAPEYVKHAAQELQIPFEQHLRCLLVHGICHLLGYDHIEDADFEIMNKKEKEILAHLERYNS